LQESKVHLERFFLSPFGLKLLSPDKADAAILLDKDDVESEELTTFASHGMDMGTPSMLVSFTVCKVWDCGWRTGMAIGTVLLLLLVDKDCCVVSDEITDCSPAIVKEEGTFGNENRLALFEEEDGIDSKLIG
jgi:hypothetical protein